MRGDARPDEGDDFVGRAAETELLSAAADRAARGAGGLWLVAGEAGIGKTRLVEHLVQGTAALEVHWATCWEGDGAPALWPWTQILRSSLGRPSLSSPRELLAGPDDAGPVADDADALRFKVFDATTEHLLGRAANQPILLVLDDLHWADDASVRLLQFLSRRVRGAPMLVVATIRDTDLDADATLTRELGDLARAGGLVQLGGLASDEFGELLGSLGVDPHDLAPTLEQQTGGNPFFTREVVQLLRADGRLDQPGRPPPAVVPATVYSVLDRRLARMPQPAYDALVVASVVGVDFETAIVAGATGRSVSRVEADLAPARAGRLVVERAPDRLRFAHALVRAALYEGIDGARRAALHRRIASAIEADGGGGARVAELAHHLMAGLVGGGVDAEVDVDRVIDHTRRAAARASEAAAYEDAAGWYERAFELLRRTGRGGTAAAGELLVGVGEARLASGAVDAARGAFLDAAAIARETGEPSLLVSAALGFGAGLTGFEVRLFDRAQIELLEHALAALPVDDSPARVAVLARLSVAMSFIGDVTRRQTLAEQAVDMARRIGEPAALGHALAALADVIAGPDHVEARAAIADEVVALARRAGNAPLELLGRRFRVVALLEQGRLSEAEVEAGAYAERVESVRHPTYRWYVPLWTGMLALARGDLDAVERHVDEAAAIGELASSENARMLTATQRWYLLRASGRFAEAGRLLLDAMGPLFRSTGTSGWLGVGDLEMGEAERARPLVRQLQDQLAAAPRDAEWLGAVATMGQAAIALGERTMAATALGWLSPHAGRFVIDGIGAAVAGSVDWHLARLAEYLGDRDAAARHDAEAAASEARAGFSSGYPPLVAPSSGPVPRSTPAAAGRATLRLEGDTWAIGFEGRSVRLRDSKGLRDIAVLVERPGTDVHVAELTSVVLASAHQTIDGDAIAAYRARLVELEEDLADADADHDIERSARLSAERDALIAELVGGVGLGGRSRRLDDPVERARKAVRARVRDCIDRITRLDPDLGLHLRNSIRTGTFCSYRPERPVAWTVVR